MEHWSEGRKIVGFCFWLLLFSLLGIRIVGLKASDAMSRWEPIVLVVS